LSNASKNSREQLGVNEATSKNAVSFVNDLRRGIRSTPWNSLMALEEEFEHRDPRTRSGKDC